VNYDLSPEHELVRSTVREFAEQRVAPVAAELDREHRFPYELVAELAERKTAEYQAWDRAREAEQREAESGEFFEAAAAEPAA